VGLVVAVLAMAIVGTPFLFLIDNASGWMARATALILGFLFGWPIAAGVGIVALVLSIIGLRRSRKLGRRLAVVALVLSVLAIVVPLGLELYAYVTVIHPPPVDGYYY
jgi:hypothetical protein